MHDPQLPLFDWAATMMGDGYRKLAAFQFDLARDQFLYVQESGQGEQEELTQALKACDYWKNRYQELQAGRDPEAVQAFYYEFRRYPFGKIPGLHQFKNALLEFITARLQASDQFYLKGAPDETVADLFVEMGYFIKAKNTIEKRFENHPEDVMTKYHLAQIQWLNKSKGEAKSN